MKLLNLSINQIGRKGVELLEKCIHKIQPLILLKCGLIAEDIEILSKSLFMREQMVCKLFSKLSALLKTLSDIHATYRKYDTNLLLLSSPSITSLLNVNVIKVGNL